MTSPRGSTRGRRFAVAAEIDDAAVRRINSALLNLSQHEAGKAMRRGFGKWSKVAKRTVEAMAPLGRMAATEKVRGSERPNVHLKFSAHAKVKGYRKGLVQWVAVGIKEIAGSYLTPHWYLRWVENGHAIKRRSTNEEMIRAVSRGERRTRNMKTTTGRVAPNPFMRRAAMASLPLAEGFIVAEVEKALRKV